MFEINVSDETKDLIEKANSVYRESFNNAAWFGRCIFLSWYCDVGTCKFCFRSTQKSRIQHAQNARRSIASLLTEAIIAKNCGWRIEFLTGGYKIYPMEELVKIAKLVSQVYGEKIWLNLGVLKKEELEQFLPYIKGIVASIETIDEELHNSICPDKPIAPYDDLLDIATELGLKKSMTIVIGLGEKREHFSKLADFIIKHNLDRITFYALKPIKDTPYDKEPSSEDYLWWIANLRIRFPKLEIIAGTTIRRVAETDLVLKAGANAITKFPATKKFGTEEAKVIEENAAKAGRKFISTLTKLPDVDWHKEVDKLDDVGIDSELKEKVRETLMVYVRKMKKSE